MAEFERQRLEPLLEAAVTAILVVAADNEVTEYQKRRLLACLRLSPGP